MLDGGPRPEGRKLITFGLIIGYANTFPQEKHSDTEIPTYIKRTIMLKISGKYLLNYATQIPG